MSGSATLGRGAGGGGGGGGGGAGGGGAGGAGIMSGSHTLGRAPHNGKYATLSKQCKTLESNDFY